MVFFCFRHTLVTLAYNWSVPKDYFCWKILALVAAAIYIWGNVGECPFALLSAPILRTTLCGREKGRLINFIFVLASPFVYHLVVHLFRTEPVETRKGLVQGRTITLLGGESDLFKVWWRSSIILQSVKIEILFCSGEFRLDPVDVFLGIPYALPPIGPRR